MDLIKLMLVVLRRWYVVLPLLIVGTLLSLLVARGIPPEYSATGLIVVVDGAAETGGVTTGALAETVQDGDTRQEILRGEDSTYRVTPEPDGILRVTATASTSAEAIRVATTVLDQLTPAASELSPGANVQILNRPNAAESDESGFRAQGSARLLGVNDEEAGGFNGRAASSLLSQLLAGGAVYSEATVGDSEYEVVASRDLPTIAVNATGTDDREVLATIQNVFNLANPQLDELARLTGAQSSTAEARPLRVPTSAEEETKGAFRSLVALLALTAAIAVGAALLIESYLERRRPRHSRGDQNARTAAAPPLTTSEPDPPAEPTDSVADGRSKPRQRLLEAQSTTPTAVEPHDQRFSEREEPEGPRADDNDSLERPVGRAKIT